MPKILILGTLCQGIHVDTYMFSAMGLRVKLILPYQSQLYLYCPLYLLRLSKTRICIGIRYCNIKKIAGRVHGSRGKGVSALGIEVGLE